MEAAIVFDREVHVSRVPKAIVTDSGLLAPSGGTGSIGSEKPHDNELRLASTGRGSDRAARVGDPRAAPYLSVDVSQAAGVLL